MNQAKNIGKNTNESKIKDEKINREEKIEGEGSDRKSNEITKLNKEENKGKENMEENVRGKNKEENIKKESNETNIKKENEQTYIKPENKEENIKKENTKKENKEVNIKEENTNQENKKENKYENKEENIKHENNVMNEKKENNESTIKQENNEENIKRLNNEEKIKKKNNEEEKEDIMKNEIKENNISNFQKDKKIQDNSLNKLEKDYYKITNINIYFLSNKKAIIEKANTISFSIIQTDYGKGDLTYLSNIKPKGLVNLGGCCYMNSTLQCLYHIKEFTDYFLKNRKFIQKKNGLISTGLLDTFEGLSKSEEVSFYSPIKFKDNLIGTDDSFEGKDGNDSGDLLFTILSNCQEELGNESDPHDMSLDQRQENLIFSDIFHKNLEAHSIINDIFGFYVRVKNICFECGSIYYSIDLENMIVFNLEQVFRMNAPDLTINYDKRVVNVENCLSTFSFDKSSFCSKGMFCKYCNKKSNQFNVKSFATLPKYFIMIMYRGKDEKFECKVDFQEILDLNDSYYNTKGVPKEKTTKYSLQGGTILYGSKGYGHTVAFCRHFDGEYYIFNDSSFMKTNFNEIKKKKIYLLIYKKMINY